MGRDVSGLFEKIRSVVAGRAFRASERHAAAGGPWKTAVYRREADATFEAAARALLIGDLIAWEFSDEGAGYVEVTKERRPEVFAEVLAWLDGARTRIESMPAPPYRGMGALDWARRDRVPAPPHKRTVACNDGWMDLLIDGAWPAGDSAVPRGDRGVRRGGAVAPQQRTTYVKIIAALMVESGFDKKPQSRWVSELQQAIGRLGVEAPTEKPIRSAIEGVADALGISEKADAR